MGEGNPMSRDQTHAGLTASLKHTRIDLLGVGISDTNPDDVVRTVGYWLDQGCNRYICVTPVSGVMAAQRNPAVMGVLNESGLTVPDGTPVVWAGRYAGALNMRRVYGPELMTSVCRRAVSAGWPSFFYGGKPGVADQLVQQMRKKHPGIPIAGAATPPFRELTEDELSRVATDIDASGARLVWIGISTPRQDLLMARLVKRLKGPVVLIGVGAAFDVHAGIVRRPPQWLGPLGLFWLYRLIQDPRRLGRRYLRDIPQFMVSVARRQPEKSDSGPGRV